MKFICIKVSLWLTLAWSRSWKSSGFTLSIPLYKYGLPLWKSRFSNNAMVQLNSVFTSFLKRWLGVPKWAKNGIVHYVCGTTPFVDFLEERASSLGHCFQFPSAFHGFRPSFLGPKAMEVEHSVSAQDEEVPVELLNQVPHNQDLILPQNPWYRKNLARKLFDIDHMNACRTEDFHNWAKPDCICTLCGNHREAYHSCVR